MKRDVKRGALPNTGPSKGAIAELAVHDGDRTLEKRPLSGSQPFASKDDSGLSYKVARNNFCDLLSKRGNGSLLRGWRSELDTFGFLDVSFSELCAVAGRIGYREDILLLYGMDEGQYLHNISAIHRFPLSDLDAALHKRLTEFKEWIKAKFFTPIGFYSAMERDAGPHYDEDEPITLDRFEDFIGVKGFECSEEEVAELFGFCDGYGAGCVTKDDVVILETDAHQRDMALFQIKTRKKEQRQRFLASVYLMEKESKNTLPPKHRLAIRGWQAPKFEALPTVVTQRREEWRQDGENRAARALTDFKAELLQRFGCMARAWRRALDPQGSWKVTLAQIRRHCRKTNSGVDIRALWKHLDSDCSGAVELEELCSLTAAHLATFAKWARVTFGSCVAVWERGWHCNQQSGWASNKKMITKDFASALKTLKWPEATDRNARRTVLRALDLCGCGFVERADLAWLDSWNTPEWLAAAPDFQACEQFKALLLEKYHHPLAAWRQLLDTDSSNSVSWDEFQSACQQVNFPGNVGGAWRALDIDLSGTVSMWEYDTKSAVLLASFKNWVDKNFGNIRLAFKAFDSDGSNTVSLQELRRICHELRWEGCVRELFDCLERGTLGAGAERTARRQLSLAELTFLDDWKIEVQAAEKMEEEGEFAPDSHWRRSTAGGRRMDTMKNPNVRRETSEMVQRLTTKCKVSEFALSSASAPESRRSACMPLPGDRRSALKRQTLTASAPDLRAPDLLSSLFHLPPVAGSPVEFGATDQPAAWARLRATIRREHPSTVVEEAVGQAEAGSRPSTSGLLRFSSLPEIRCASRGAMGGDLAVSEIDGRASRGVMETRSASRGAMAEDLQECSRSSFRDAFS